jgi:calcium-dependent protein kinase
MGCDLSKVCPIFFKKREEPQVSEGDLNLNKYEMLYDREETTKDNNEVSQNIFDNKLQVQELTDLKISVSKLVLERKCSILDLYEEVCKLGSGSYGEVFKVRHKKKGEIRAMKRIPKAENMDMDFNTIAKEINILKALDHPNIIKIYEFFQDNDYYYIINELCEYGDLSNIIENESALHESTVKIIMKQILSSVAYLHAKNVIHGDLKLENILVESRIKYGSRNSIIANPFNRKRTENIEIKLIDFGCSKIFAKGKLTGVIGTSTYCSPEVIKNNYNEKCDIWACGVIMYILLSGLTPFDGDSDKEIFESILRGEIDFSDPAFNGVSQSAIDLIKILMTFNSEKRCSAKAALTHPFLQFEDSSYDKLKLDPSMMNSLKTVKSRMKFYQAVVAYISHNFACKDEVSTLRKLFKFLDKNGDGTICKDELLMGYKAFGEEISESTVNNIIEAIDHDNNGYIEYEEFLRSLLNKDKLLTETNLKLAFDLFDTDHSGEISVDEIKSLIFGVDDVPEKVITEFLAQINKTPDQMINFEDFKKLMLE